ncbi:MAG: 2-oxoglutarate dehydrogenase E1 component [Saprospiraceae bacterium]|nr:2-oxoglutarate dehydrogenase E1 component [Saprospiraceae bacterium]
MKDHSFLSNAHPSYIEDLYQKWSKDPESVDFEWSRFFQGFNMGLGQSENNHKPEFLPKELSVFALIEAYRQRGHLLSDTNPIRTRKDRKPGLSIGDFGLSESDLKEEFIATSVLLGRKGTLAELIAQLRKIYCEKIGFEYQYIEDQKKYQWLKKEIESRKDSLDFGLNLDRKKGILKDLNGAVIFEKFLHTKYVGQKRFSLEGGESTIPALHTMIQEGSELGVEEVVIGMAHRGRLNVLANVLGKTYEQIFSEFEGTAVPDLSFGSGDVKYHLGFSSQIKTEMGKTIQLKLAPNPSHLESVDPVVEGLARAKADLLYKSDYDKILPILIHGDAAVAGQGVVYETLQMSQLEGYYTGGTIHFIINNQIGFTTDFEDARSSTYSSSVAAIVQAPVFHVNGDDPEAVVYVAELALKYRQEFNTDVFIDMVCYRRHGHNEGDDPKFTQPSMYHIISQHPNVRDQYISVLNGRGELEKKMAEDLEKEFWEVLQLRLDQVKEKPLPYAYQEPELAWKNLRKNVREYSEEDQPVTGIQIDDIKILFSKILNIPKDFRPLAKVEKILKQWKSLAEKELCDWSMAETLAYASLLSEGKNVRLSGQDVKRGTFSHRHAVLFDEKNNLEYNRLNQISENQGKFLIYNSLLSEFAVLGFEYGYSLATPNHLVIWEAQFGDFSNGAQVIFDQYIASAELKWSRMSGLVLLLPHGYDGQGPEHSSARMERYLQACAEFNIIVANVSTPSNFFHLMRRQLAFNFRKPLVVMSPKSLFRHPECMSSLNEFGPDTKFKEIMIDPIADPKSIEKILFCSGQVYYDLKRIKEKDKKENILLVRLEQLYPFPTTAIKEILHQYPKVESRWVQEEPLNMGAAAHVRSWWPGVSLTVVARPASASPAVGYKKVHESQQEEILYKAFM